MDASYPQNHYGTLDIPTDADLATIRKAFRKLALLCHPDRLQDDSEREQRAKQFCQVQQAFEILSDENRRRQYDQMIQLTKLREETPRLLQPKLPPRPQRPHNNSRPDFKTPEVDDRFRDSERPDRSYSVSTYTAHSFSKHQSRPFSIDEKFSRKSNTANSTDSGYFTQNPSGDSSVPQTARCSDCPDKIFALPNQKKSLQRHLRDQHGDMKRLDCLVLGCTVTFAPGRTDNLKRHVRDKHPLYPFPAPSSKRDIRSKASDADNVGPMERMSTIPGDESMSTASDDASTGSPTAKKLSSWSDDEISLDLSLELSEDFILAGLGAYVDRGKGPPTETISKEYEKMLASMSHHSTDDKLAVIRTQVLEALFTGEANQQHCASVEVDWDILAFLEDQFHDQERPHSVLGCVITITGSAQHAQATTCLDYVQQNWAAHGSGILDAIQDALLSPNEIFHSTIGANSVDVNMSGDNVLSSVAELRLCVDHKAFYLRIQSGIPDIVVGIVQQLAWMGAALRTSADGQVQYCEPKLEQVSNASSGKPAAFRIIFKMSSLSEEDHSCWLPLFANPVIARGFPIPERKNGEQGIELPLEIMAALGGARHAMDFEGGLVLKGYSTFFIPIERYQDSVQWHLICATGENRVSFAEVSTQCPDRALFEDLRHDELGTMRTFLGVWKVAETHLATHDADYDVDWSKAEEAGSSFRLTGGTLGFSKVVSAQMNFVLGAKDGPYHHSQQGPFQKIIDHVEKLPVVLYDQMDRRAWLVSALAVILHMIQLRHHIKPFVVDGNIVQISPLDPSMQRYAAREAVAMNKSKKLFDCETHNENDYCFRDAILDYSSILDGLMGREVIKQATPGKEVHTTLQDTLYGWEFRDVTDEESLFKQKAQVLKKTAGQWNDLVKGVGAVVLFASGFGDIIRPTSESAGLCRKWRRLPKDHDYLAVYIRMLEIFYKKAGHRRDHQYLTSAKHQWHRGSMLFEHCAESDSDCCNCDRLQQVYHDSYKVLGHWRPPGILEANGCVVFGQAQHPFKPRKKVPMKYNTVHMLPNTHIRNDGAVRHDRTKDDGSLTSSLAASVSLEPDENKNLAMRIPKQSLSPPSSIDRPGHNQTVTLRRMRKMMFNTKSSESDTCKEHDICSSGGPLPEGENYVTYPKEYQAIYEHDRKPNDQVKVSTQSVYTPEIEYGDAHVRKNVHREAIIENIGHPCGCSCTRCLTMNFGAPRGIEMVGNITGARRSSTGGCLSLCLPLGRQSLKESIDPVLYLHRAALSTHLPDLALLSLTSWAPQFEEQDYWPTSRKGQMLSDMKYQKCENRTIWTHWHYFRGRERAALSQLREFADEDRETPLEGAPTGLRPASKKNADRELTGRDNLLVRHSSSNIFSSSFCDLSNYTTNLTPPSLSTQTAHRHFQRPNLSLYPTFLSDPDPVDQDNTMSPSSPAPDDPTVFNAFLDTCIEKTSALIGAAKEALISSSSSDADFRGESDVSPYENWGDNGRYRDRARRKPGASIAEEAYPPPPPHRLISHHGSRNSALGGRLDDDRNGAQEYVREGGRGRGEVAPRKDIVRVQGWWKNKDGEASWREVGSGR